MPANRNRLGRAGFTLVEMMTGVATLAVFSLIALPRAEGMFAHAAVQAARSEVAGKIRLAQLMATQGARTAIVRVNGNWVWVEARPRVVPLAGSTADTIGSMVNLSNVHKVVIVSSMDSVLYQPTGIATAAGTVVIERHGIRDSVVINALGLVVR